MYVDACMGELVTISNTADDTEYWRDEMLAAHHHGVHPHRSKIFHLSNIFHANSRFFCT